MTSRSRPSASAGTVLRALARRVHFLAGVVVAPFLVMVCLTGLVYVFSPQIHDGLYHSQLYVSQVTGSPHPLSEQVAAALRAHPEGTVRSVIPPPEPHRTTRVVLSVPGLDDVGEPVRARTVYVDPYTNYVNGELTTLADQLPANTWLRDLHGNLHLGAPGRLYSELAASWLPYIVLGGVVLWLAQPGRKRRLGDLLRPSARGRSARLRLRGVKGPLGLWLAVGVLVVGVTGLAMSQYAGGRADQAVNPVDAPRPTLTASPVEVPADGRRIGVDKVLAVAEADGLGGEVVVTVPSAADQPFTVTEKGLGLPVERDALAINPYTAEVTERIDWIDWPFLAKVSVLGAEFHTGTLFGLPNQIMVALLAVGILVLIVLSYAMWWKRSPYGQRWAALPPPAWRQLPPKVLVVVTVAAAASSWLLPVFGVSVVAFVIVDAAINVVRRRRLHKHLAIAGGPAAARVAGLRAASAALIGAGVFVLLLGWPFGGHDAGDARSPLPQPRPPAATQHREHTRGEPTPPRTPSPGPASSPPAADPVVDWRPAPVRTGPGQETGRGPTGQPTDGPPTPSPTGPDPSPSLSPRPPSPSPPPSPPDPAPPPPGDGTPCTIRIGDLCVVVDLGLW